ncbi:Uncharacterised protein [Klebsiella pneumoniae]|nr:Uncharacterised protein [Klebsiella pneumoniae]
MCLNKCFLQVKSIAVDVDLALEFVEHCKPSLL